MEFESLNIRSAARDDALGGLTALLRSGYSLRAGCYRVGDSAGGHLAPVSGPGALCAVCSLPAGLLLFALDRPAA